MLGIDNYRLYRYFIDKFCFIDIFIDNFCFIDIFIDSFCFINIVFIDKNIDIYFFLLTDFTWKACISNKKKFDFFIDNTKTIDYFIDKTKIIDKNIDKANIIDKPNIDKIIDIAISIPSTSLNAYFSKTRINMVKCV